MDADFIKLFHSDIKAMNIDQNITEHQDEYEWYDLLPDDFDVNYQTIPIDIMTSSPNDLIIEQQRVLSVHSDQVSCITTVPNNTNIIISGSYDNMLYVLNIDGTAVPSRFMGHNDRISDIDISADGKYIISASYDGFLKLWNIDTAQCERHFMGHNGRVLAVVFSLDNRQIISSGKDKTLKVWNTIGIEKRSIPLDYCVMCIVYSPSSEKPLFMTGDIGGNVKIWNDAFEVTCTLVKKHESEVTAITISPDGSLCATTDRNGNVYLWDIDGERFLSKLKACHSKINDVVYSPTRYWCCVAVADGIQIWDLETKETAGFLRANDVSNKRLECKCISWNESGDTLFAGYSDNKIRVWKLTETEQVLENW